MSLFKLAASEADITYALRDAEEDLTNRIIAGAPVRSIQSAYDRYLAIASSNPAVVEKEHARSGSILGSVTGGLSGATIGALAKTKWKGLKGGLAGAGLGVLAGGGLGYLLGKRSGAKESQQAMREVMSPPNVRYKRLIDMLNTMKYRPYTGR